LTDFRPVQSIVKAEDYVYISIGEDDRSFNIRGDTLEDEKWQEFKRQFKERLKESTQEVLASNLKDADGNTLRKRLEIYQYIDRVRNDLNNEKFLPFDAGVILESPKETANRPKKALYFFKNHQYLVYSLEKVSSLEEKCVLDLSPIQGIGNPFWPGMTFD